MLPMLAAQSDDERALTLDSGTDVLACPCSTRFGERVALLAWRPPGSRGWDGDDLTLAGSVSGIVRIVLEHESIQRELARQARTDPLTGLLNRRAFLEEASRRLDRLERDGLPGTLLFIDLDRLKQLNDRCGHEAGDAALLLVSSLLQRTFRPADLIARLGGDEFAVWLDGADSLTAAERAESLRLETPSELAHLTAGDPDGMSMSIGIATREPGEAETLTELIQRADRAMYDVKRAGRGHWLVSHTRGPQ
jgi:diguanylate cyclase (GGDEF)-like protein